jgi:di- and tripeptidase
MLMMPCFLSDDPEKEILVSGGGDGSIRLWSLDETNGGAIKELFSLDDGREEGDSVLSLALDGTFLITGRIDGEVNFWDLDTRQLVRSFPLQTGNIMSLTVGSSHLYAAGANGMVEVRTVYLEFLLNAYVCRCWIASLSGSTAFELMMERS